MKFWLQYFLYVLTASACTFQSIAQNTVIDSLEKLLKKENRDSGGAKSNCALLPTNHCCGTSHRSVLAGECVQAPQRRSRTVGDGRGPH